MKKLIFSLVVLTMLASCKKSSEEVESDEVKIENPADTIVAQDTVAVVERLEDDIRKSAEKEATESASETTPKANEIAANYASFGKKISPDKPLTKSQMLKEYKALKTGDTINVKFASTIKEVCKKKGCWMSMELADGKESFVRFKDYGFFVPLNADKSEAIVSGKAFVDVVSVAQLQHYAKDGGKSQEEIDKITEPKVTYAFQADGVLIKE